MAFLNFYQHTKSQFILLIPFWDTANFGVYRPKWPHPILTMPTPIFFNKLLYSINLYQHAKNQTFSSLCSGDMVNLKWSKSCNLIGWEHFGPYFRNQIFPKYGISARIQPIIWTFFIDQTQKKLMTKFSNKSIKPYFSSIFPILGTKKFL